MDAVGRVVLLGFATEVVSVVLFVFLVARLAIVASLLIGSALTMIRVFVSMTRSGAVIAAATAPVERYCAVADTTAAQKVNCGTGRVGYISRGGSVGAGVER